MTHYKLISINLTNNEGNSSTVKFDVQYTFNNGKRIF